MATKTTNSSKTTNDFNYINEGGGSVSGNVFNNDTFSSAKAVTSVKIGNLTLPVSSTGITALPGKYGIFYFKADGSYTYTLDESKTALQALAQGQTDNEHPVYYTVNGITELTSNLIVRVTGTNDIASITVVSDGDYSVTEDTDYQAGGQLTVSDVDNGEAGFKVLSSLSGDYGSFVFNNDGTWTFTGDNGAATQKLGAGDTAIQSLTVSSLDGTATQTITVIINGVNDEAVISAVEGGDYSVTEDSDSAAGGSLAVTDVDDGEAGFNPVDESALAGTYGTFTFDSSTGTWGYLLNNAATIVQNLNTGDVPPTDTLTVTSLDGTKHDIVVTINGMDESQLPPADGGGSSGGNTNDPSDPFGPVNSGNLKPYIVNGFDANDKLRYSADQVNYKEFTLIDAYGDSGIQDTKVTFEWEKGGKYHTGDAILVDFVGFVPEAHLIAVNN